jgi:gluconate 2-dehydrogenase alpha chain
LTRKDFAPDELRNNYRGWPQGVQKANQEIPTSRANASSPTGPRGNIHPMQNAVGGTTLHYWAQSWRLNPWDFKVVSETKRRYGASRIPQGSTVEDWPFGLDDLEPFYDKVEYEVGVSGQAGNIDGKIDPRGNRFEGPRKRAYPMPPLRSTEFLEKMTAAARTLGWHPVPRAGGCELALVPESIRLHVSRLLQPRRMPRRRQELHGGDDDPAGAGDRSLQSRDARARDDDRGRRRRPRHRRHLRDRRRRVLSASEVVLLASFTYENVRLLLLSKSKAFPNGLSNNHGQVGRHYFSHHQGRAGDGVVPLRSPQLVRAAGARASPSTTGPTTTSTTRASISSAAAISGRCPIAARFTAAGMNTFGRVPNWGSAWKRFVKENADRSHSSYIQKTTLPYDDNYLDLDPTAKDPLGFPVCRITAEFKDNERKIAAFMQDKMEEWYRAAGAIAIQRAPVGGAMGVSTHAYGGTRMGDNADTNVVNRWGLSHESPNLGVLGASVMGTSGAHNPTLTVQALAWRTAEYVAKNWKTIARSTGATL